MCIILIGSVTKEQYEQAKRENPDGYSLFTKDLGVIKAPSIEETNKALNTFGIWHFRIGTSGKKDESNIHPFPICKGKYLLYHNGIVCSPKGDKSDTHLLGDFLSNTDLVTAKMVLQSIVKHKYNNKFVIVSASDPTEYYIIGEWVFDNGILMSHEMPRYVASTTTPYWNGYGWNYPSPKTSQKPSTPKSQAPSQTSQIIAPKSETKIDDKEKESFIKSFKDYFGKK